MNFHDLLWNDGSHRFGKEENYILSTMHPLHALSGSDYWISSHPLLMWKQKIINYCKDKSWKISKKILPFRQWKTVCSKTLSLCLWYGNSFHKLYSKTEINVKYTCIHTCMHACISITLFPFKLAKLCKAQIWNQK